ncbi:MAG: GNAT family N-acetyltransferase [Bdellovibrionaceae bacterium]|nr:GNAT family N-acetyltransferase [Pseudobdellovibrionaceae bacterium]
MEGPKNPSDKEFSKVLDFLNKSLRKDCSWSIDKEYPTALNLNNRHNMNIVWDDQNIVSHAVLKPLIIKSPHVIYKLGAIGSVVTDENYRNQGWSTKIIQKCNQLALEQSCDVTILWTNLYEFYQKMGFELAGYEMSFVIDKDFSYDRTLFRYSSEKNISPEAIAKLYSQHTVSTVRTIEEIRKFIQIPNTHLYTAWNSQGNLAAYAVEGKGIDLQNYIHEWGGSVPAIVNLLGYIKDQKPSGFTFISPKTSVNLNSKLIELSTISNVGYLGMIKIINFDQLSQKIKKAFRNLGVSDIVLEKHADYYLFGCGQDLCTLQKESELVQLLFGPVEFSELNVFQTNTIEKLKLILPLPFWVWGWDSI